MLGVGGGRGGFGKRSHFFRIFPPATFPNYHILGTLQCIGASIAAFISHSYFHFHMFWFWLKSERSHLFKNAQFNLSCWMKWLFCKYSVFFNTFELLTLVISQFWTLELFLFVIRERKSSRVQTLFLNSWTFDLFEYIIFELLNSSFIWTYRVQ